MAQQERPDVTPVRELGEKLIQNIETVIMGKQEIIRKAVICLLAGGHILLEDIPGPGKTTLAKAIARSVGCSFGRVQFTPDLLPSDLTGVSFYNQKEQRFEFKPGAVFTNILLADEINRATPRTQSSLLECMEERQVSVDGVTHRLEEPFLVMATQNPIEIQGTFPLPEAQLDRFLMRLSMGYPAAEDEKRMLLGFSASSPLDTLKPVAQAEEVIRAQRLCREVFAGEAVCGYIVAIAEASRTDEGLRYGASPRASLALLHAAQAHAALEGRGYVLPDDVKAVCADVLCHRVLCRAARGAQAKTEALEILRQILVRVPAPTEDSLR